MGCCKIPLGKYGEDRKSTRLNSSHTEIYTLSLHDALPICRTALRTTTLDKMDVKYNKARDENGVLQNTTREIWRRSEEHTSELQSHRDLHSFPTRRSSDLQNCTEDYYS